MNNIIDFYDLNNNNYISNKLKKIYPDINSIDEELLNDMISNIIYEDTKNFKQSNNDVKFNINNDINNIDSNANIINNIDDLENKNNLTNKKISEDYLLKEAIKQNILMANKIIPEMSLKSNLIYLNGKLSEKNVNIIIDTGASSCFIYKSIIDKCGLNYLIDTNSVLMVKSAHGIKSTIGTIWYLEIDLEIEKDKFISIPVTVDIIDDSDIIKGEKKNIMNDSNYKMNTNLNPNIIENNLQNPIKKKKNTDKLEIILGIGFLKSYRASIDFSTMTLTLNKTIKIKFL